ncbi:IS3 family transposase [Streptomyces sp. NPDC085929]|uniref:IS3 family transposase n=1 Tax=Streptomyces sp. NPDC085929 TaxID=3365739 RepID=UPI0037D4EDDD
MKTRRWDFVSALAETFGVQRICRVLRVFRSGYYRWIAGARTRQERQAADDALLGEIREIHTEHKGAYGVRRVHAELCGFGHTVNRKRVERLMRINRLEGRHLRRRKRTTVPDRLAPPAPDLIQRDFSAVQLDEKWCGDVTYVQVGGSWLYPACVLDICSRRVLGWSMASHMRAELVIDALKMAAATRGGNVDGVIFHADRDSQYTSAAFAQVCDGFGIRRRMGRVSSSYDCQSFVTGSRAIVPPRHRSPWASPSPPRCPQGARPGLTGEARHRCRRRPGRLGGHRRPAPRHLHHGARAGEIAEPRAGGRGAWSTLRWTQPPRNPSLPPHLQGTRSSGPTYRR